MEAGCGLKNCGINLYQNLLNSLEMYRTKTKNQIGRRQVQLIVLHNTICDCVHLI